MPCGKCDDCRRILAEQHPDVTVVRAEAEGGALKVEQIREQRRLLTLKPFQARYRVLILARFQEANDSAANALLKTLEEAPEHAVLVITADSAEGLLPTIVSRCEVLRLQPLQVAQVQAWLEEQGAPAEEASLVAHITGGRPGAALGLYRDKAALADRARRLDQLVALLAGSRAQRFAYANKLSEDKAAMRDVLLMWVSFWRDVLWRASGASTPLSNIDHESEITELARLLDLAGARRLAEKHDRALRRLEQNINARLLAEDLLLDWPRLQRARKEPA
jgi:DNA polymerase-3 subunit delta'